MDSDTCVLGDWDLYEGAYDVKAAAVLEGGIRCDLNVNVVREVSGGFQKPAFGSLCTLLAAIAPSSLRLRGRVPPRRPHCEYRLGDIVCVRHLLS